MGVPAAGKKLSQMQKNILGWALYQTELIETRGNDFAKSMLRIWGVKWYPAKGQEDWTRSDSASFSRAIRNLVKRGLILRQNDISDSPNRANHIKLTQEGRDLAKLLRDETNC